MNGLVILVWFLVVISAAGIALGLWLQTNLILNRNKNFALTMFCKLVGFAAFCVFVAVGANQRVFTITGFFVLCSLFLGLLHLATKKTIR